MQRRWLRRVRVIKIVHGREKAGLPSHRLDEPKVRTREKAPTTSKSHSNWETSPSLGNGDDQRSQMYQARTNMWQWHTGPIVDGKIIKGLNEGCAARVSLKRLDVAASRPSDRPGRD